MANKDSTTTIATPSIPVHYAAPLDLSGLQRVNNTLLQQATQPRRTEVSELLHRHYEDKSYIDTWTSWAYELSFLQKASLSISVISVAGLSGAILGLAFPFIAIASSLLYATLSLLNEHEQHRRDRGARLAEENSALANRLDQMMDQFKQIAADMTTALEQVKTQAIEMSEHNAEISQRTDEHAHEQAQLQEIIAAVEYTEKVRSDVVAITFEITSGLQSIPAHIDEATCAVHDFKNTVEQIEETTHLIHQTEKRLVALSERLQNSVDSTSTPIYKSTTPFEPELESAIFRSKNALAKARALRQERQECNIEQSYSILRT